jgi:hypothetical protein
MPVEAAGLEEPPKIPRGYDQTECGEDFGDGVLLC